MLASSFIMVAYGWIKHLRQIHSGDVEAQENDFLTEEDEQSEKISGIKLKKRNS